MTRRSLREFHLWQALFFPVAQVPITTHTVSPRLETGTSNVGYVEVKAPHVDRGVCLGWIR